MCRFSPLSNSMLRLWIFFQCVIEAFQKVLHFMEDIIPSTAPSFKESQSYILKLLETHSETSDQIISAMKQWNSICALPVAVVSKDIWPKDCPRIRVQTHIKSTLADAVNLLKATSRTLSTADEKYLSLLLTHYCGWSATYPEQMDEPWVQFFHKQYPQLRGLTPVLDSMTYPEELVEFPDGYNFIPDPEFFLLATSDSYFIYNATDGEDGLRPAGNTLEDVYNGMRDWKYADSSEDPWDFVEEEGCLNQLEYFPHYDRLENGNFGMAVWGRRYLKEYPGRQPKGLFDIIRRIFKY